jgi:putative endonuclease
MTYKVYMLLNCKNNVTYVGYTNNIDKRLSLHNKSKGAKFTRGRHWVLIYIEKHQTKKIAMKREYLLKKNRTLRYKIKMEYLNKINENSYITAI